jgi:hypothetical protein
MDTQRHWQPPGVARNSRELLMDPTWTQIRPYFRIESLRLDGFLPNEAKGWQWRDSGLGRILARRFSNTQWSSEPFAKFSTLFLSWEVGCGMRDFHSLGRTARRGDVE